MNTLTCQSCRNLKLGRFTYSELVKKWEEIYFPNKITPGYQKRMAKEAVRAKTPFPQIRFRYIYCSEGILSRFYLVRGEGIIKPKAKVTDCHYYQ
jgi:hypothetical protein